jgi:hypothetical protein
MNFLFLLSVEFFMGYLNISEVYMLLGVFVNSKSASYVKC